MVDEVIDFKDAAVKSFSVSKNALFECFHSIFGARRYPVGSGTPSPFSKEFQ